MYRTLADILVQLGLTVTMFESAQEAFETAKRAAIRNQEENSTQDRPPAPRTHTWASMSTTGPAGSQ